MNVKVHIRILLKFLELRFRMRSLSSSRRVAQCGARWDFAYLCGLDRLASHWLYGTGKERSDRINVGHTGILLTSMGPDQLAT